MSDSDSDWEADNESTSILNTRSPEIQNESNEIEPSSNTKDQLWGSSEFPTSGGPFENLLSSFKPQLSSSPSQSSVPSSPNTSTTKSNSSSTAAFLVTAYKYSKQGAYVASVQAGLSILTTSTPSNFLLLYSANKQKITTSIINSNTYLTVTSSTSLCFRDDSQTLWSVVFSQHQELVRFSICFVYALYLFQQRNPATRHQFISFSLNPPSTNQSKEITNTNLPLSPPNTPGSSFPSLRANKCQKVFLEVKGISLPPASTYEPQTVTSQPSSLQTTQHTVTTPLRIPMLDSPFYQTNKENPLQISLGSDSIPKGLEEGLKQFSSNDYILLLLPPPHTWRDATDSVSQIPHESLFSFSSSLPSNYREIPLLFMVTYLEGFQNKENQIESTKRSSKERNSKDMNQKSEVSLNKNLGDERLLNVSNQKQQQQQQQNQETKKLSEPKLQKIFEDEKQQNKDDFESKKKLSQPQLVLQQPQTQTHTPKQDSQIKHYRQQQPPPLSQQKENEKKEEEEGGGGEEEEEKEGEEGEEGEEKFIGSDSYHSFMVESALNESSDFKKLRECLNSMKDSVDSLVPITSYFFALTLRKSMSLVFEEIQSQFKEEFPKDLNLSSNEEKIINQIVQIIKNSIKLKTNEIVKAFNVPQTKPDTTLEELYENLSNCVSEFSNGISEIEKRQKILITNQLDFDKKINRQKHLERHYKLQQTQHELQISKLSSIIAEQQVNLDKFQDRIKEFSTSVVESNPHIFNSPQIQPQPQPQPQTQIQTQTEQSNPKDHLLMKSKTYYKLLSTSSPVEYVRIASDETTTKNPSVSNPPNEPLLKTRVSPVSSNNHQDDKILMEGYLQKQGHMIRNWKRRYFVLTTDPQKYILSYYVDKESFIGSGKAYGTISLKKNGSVCSVSMNEQKTLKLPENCFSVLSDDGKLFYIAASSPSEMNAWIQALQSIFSGPR